MRQFEMHSAKGKPNKEQSKPSGGEYPFRLFILPQQQRMGDPDCSEIFKEDKRKDEGENQTQ